jgi:curved DNA-binding protein CbpA
VKDDPKGPPKLERVPTGYKPPAVPRPASADAPPPAAQRPATAEAFGASGREVGADAAIAAGLAHQGQLAREGALRLFYLAAATQASGRLTLAPEGREVSLTFKRGTVEHVRSSDPSDDLGRWLVRKGAVTPEQLVQAEGARPAAGGDLVGALIARSLVNPAEVAGLLQEHGTALVGRALAVEAGSWRWEPGVAPPPGAFPLGSPWVQLCAAARALDGASVQRRLGDREHRAAARVGGRIRIEDLRLTPQETRAASLFDGVRSPSEIARAQPAEAATVLRLALLLGEVELLGFGATRKAPPAPAAKPPPAAAARPPGPPPAPPAGPAEAAGGAARPPAAAPPPPTPRPPPAAPPVRAPSVTPPPRPPPAALEAGALEALHARIQEADHFEVLGVKRGAGAAQIKIAYFQLARTYHPDAVPTTASPEVKKLCADVFARIGAAWEVLGEDASRAKYLQELESGAAEVDVVRILRAEEAFSEATLLVKARRYPEAIARLDEAIGLNADEPEFGMWKAFCEFLLAPEKRVQHGPSASAIEAGLRRNPRCAQGYLFLGQMAKVCGDLDAAERHLKRGLGIAPEHADLQRELKYVRR